MNGSHATIELDGLVKRFGRDVVAVDRVSLRVDAGEILTIVGPSGCGKTTMLRLIAGFERVDAGRITISGEVVDDGRRVVPPERRHVGFVFQDYALFPHLTVGANVAFGLRDLGAAARARRVQEVLRLCALDGLDRRYPHELSGGQQQRTALARALAPGNRIVLLDEPLSNLDAALRRSVRGQLRDMLKQAGVTALMVTHEQEEALEIADRVVVLQTGRLEQIGTPQEVYGTPASPFVARFIGESNVVPGVVQESGALTEIGVVCCPPCFREGCAVDVLLRPTQLCVEPDDCAASVLVSCAYVGTHATSVIRLPSGMEVRCASEPSAALPPGTRVHVRVRGCPTLVVAGSEQDRTELVPGSDPGRTGVVPGSDPSLAPEPFAGLDLPSGSAARSR